uniref:TAZ-type domain-containing protein n=1 Tax=Steinernema glaseri TaxID=37863 RepID=A0A1I7Y949_9BILA
MTPAPPFAPGITAISVCAARSKPVHFLSLYFEEGQGVQGSCLIDLSHRAKCECKRRPSFLELHRLKCRQFLNQCDYGPAADCRVTNVIPCDFNCGKRTNKRPFLQIFTASVVFFCAQSV